MADPNTPDQTPDANPPSEGVENTAPAESPTPDAEPTPEAVAETAQATETVAAPDATPDAFAAPEFSDAEGDGDFGNIDMLDDVDLDVKIELGRTEMYIEDVLQLGVGSVVELNKLAGDPVDIYVNERLVARGEVLVLNDNFCVRINDILSSIPELEQQD